MASTGPFRISLVNALTLIAALLTVGIQLTALLALAAALLILLALTAALLVLLALSVLLVLLGIVLVSLILVGHKWFPFISWRCGRVARTCRR